MGQKLVDISNQRFGKLTAVTFVGRNEQGKAKWLCNCDCGKQLITRQTSLTSGYTTSCGCHRIEVATQNITGVGEKRKSDLIGKVFTYLTVIKCTGKRGVKGYYWLCRCKCGNEIERSSSQLISQHTRSCGCLRSEIIKLQNIGQTYTKKHGHSPRDVRSLTYNSWQAMKGRCLEPTNISWKNYGGRGIKICDRWLYGEGGKTGFECFLEDMGDRSDRNHTLDRKDLNGPYCKDNCQWATRQEQAKKKRNSLYGIYKNETVYLVDLIHRELITYNRVSYLMKRYEMSFQDVLNTLD